MIIKEEKLTSKDLNNYKYRVDYNTEYPGNFDDMVSCAYNNADAICVRARMINPKTGKRYINDSQFYIIKDKNDFNKLKDCAKKYGYTLFSPEVIDWNNCYTVDVFYPDKAGTYRIIDKRKTESFDGKRRLRIARCNEFDNGRILFNYDRMTIEDAEELAKQKSIKDPSDIYYVKFDDIMNPTTDICWYQGKSYPSDKIDMINGEVIINERKNMAIKSKLKENTDSSGTYKRRVSPKFSKYDVEDLYDFCKDYLDDAYIMSIDLKNNQLTIDYNIEYFDSDELGSDTHESVKYELNQAIKDYTDSYVKSRKFNIRESQDDAYEEFKNKCQSAIAYKQIAKICKEHGYENISKLIYINNKGKIENLSFSSDDYYMPKIYYNEDGQVNSIEVKGAHNMTIEDLQTLINNYNNALEVINEISKVDFNKLYHHSDR